VTRVAVTGASGFLGAALLDRLIAQGAAPVVLARDPARLSRKDVEVVVGDLDDEAALDRLAAGAAAFIHLAGVTHARAREDYRRVNVEGAARAARAAGKAGARFAHASSISARAPKASPYAASKRASEDAIAQERGGDHWIAVRLPAIYGPRDKATLPYFKLISGGLALEPATAAPARASLLYVDDAAAAMAAAALRTKASGVYDAADDAAEGRSWREIGATLAASMGVKARALRVPRPIVATGYVAQRAADGLAGRAPSTREGQVNEFFHDDWTAHPPFLSDVAPWRAETPLAAGFAKTVAWYQEHDLLPRMRGAANAGERAWRA
jgi:nucleoside-diphosphate-sugar epimerase